jgi:MarR family 2-MHQ and catechol resistance regulon transcriptional repressor
MGQEVDAHGLTPSQFGALESLHHLGPMSQKELGRKLLKSSGNITMVVDNLEKRHLVRRERCREDRRVVTVSLTEEGRRLIAGILPGHVQEIARRMAALSPAELEELRRLCRVLGRAARGD